MRERVVSLGQATHLQRLQSRIKHLLTPELPQDAQRGPSDPAVDANNEALVEDPGINEPNEESEPTCTTNTAAKPSRRTVPDEDAHLLYDRWNTLLAFLEHPFVEYLNRSVRQPTGTSFSRDGGPTCCNTSCTSTDRTVLMLFWDRAYLLPSFIYYIEASRIDFETHTISSCLCAGLPEILVSNGMFPTSPIEPRMAVSIDLLEFYHHLFQRSADAVTAVAAALHMFYGRRGWDVVDKAVCLSSEKCL